MKTLLKEFLVFALVMLILIFAFSVFEGMR
jgi:hypothetical protein